MSNVKPLSGINVLDFTAFEAGTACTETLAWLGAEVWKVERPKLGELSRYSLADPGKDMNMNKKSITCNLKKPEGQALMKELLCKADVMVENMGPGFIEKNGLDYETAHQINPRLIYTQIKGFNMGGPARIILHSTPSRRPWAA